MRGKKYICSEKDEISELSIHKVKILFFFFRKNADEIDTLRKSLRIKNIIQYSVVNPYLVE